MHHENSTTLSIVIPIYNEVNFLEELFKQLIFFFNNKYTEIIFVDDGSDDGSSKLLAELKKKITTNFQLKF